MDNALPRPPVVPLLEEPVVSRRRKAGSGEPLMAAARVGLAMLGGVGYPWPDVLVPRAGMATGPRSAARPATGRDVGEEENAEVDGPPPVPLPLAVAPPPPPTDALCCWSEVMLGCRFSDDVNPPPTTPLLALGDDQPVPEPNPVVCAPGRSTVPLNGLPPRLLRLACTVGLKRK